MGSGVGSRPCSLMPFFFPPRRESERENRKHVCLLCPQQNLPFGPGSQALCLGQGSLILTTCLEVFLILPRYMGKRLLCFCLLQLYPGIKGKLFFFFLITERSHIIQHQQLRRKKKNHQRIIVIWLKICWEIRERLVFCENVGDKNHRCDPRTVGILTKLKSSLGRGSV